MQPQPSPNNMRVMEQPAQATTTSAYQIMLARGRINNKDPQFVSKHSIAMDIVIWNKHKWEPNGMPVCWFSRLNYCAVNVVVV